MLKQISNLSQVAYIREYTLESGKEEGVKVIELFNNHLRVLLNKSKALDIMQIFHDGINMSLITKNGFSTRSDDFIKRFEGGMLYTVGLDSAGAREGFPLHGSFHNLKPKIVRSEITDKDIIVEALIEDSELFGKHLIMKRQYILGLDASELILKDELINNSDEDENYCLLYHNNIGYPTLDVDGRIEINAKEVLPRTPYAKEKQKEWNIITEPIDLQEETCYFIDVKDGQAAYVNNKLKKRFTIKYSKDNLPEFVLWKSMRSGDYALGLEPSTTKLDDDFKYGVIKKKTSVRFEIIYRIDNI